MRVPGEPASFLRIGGSLLLIGGPTLVAVGLIASAGPMPPLPPPPPARPAPPPAPPDLGIDLELRWVPVGSPADGLFFGAFEVTNAQYLEFVDATGYDGSDHPSSKAAEPFLAHVVDGRCPDDLRTHPACNLNLHHARAFCDWLTERSGWVVRLPTDREWERAARGTEGRAYPWGNSWDPARCNWGDSTGGDHFGRWDGFGAAAPVGSFPTGATPEGLHDMAGNIWEWTAEGHLRGGPWCLGADMMRCEIVAREDVDQCNDKFGFRVVVEPPPRMER